MAKWKQAMSDVDEITVEGLKSGAAPRYSRRLSDKILIAFHHACDQGDYEIAEQLLHILENMLTRRTMPADANRRKSIESLVAAHERLWHLRHPEKNFG
jgi:ankyrin repeat protein